jgi:hypothetical protein
VAADTGELLRDNLGAWLQGFSMNGGFCALVKAELWAVVTSLELAWSYGCRKIILETDIQQWYKC